MIKIYRRGEDSGTNHECTTVADAHALFDAESHVIVARCQTDDECWDLMAAVVAKSRLSAEKGILDTVMIWAPNMRQVDGDGWRLVFEQQEALTAKGAAKQQAAQQQQMAAQQAAMQRMMGGGGGGGFQHPANGQRGVRR